MDPTTRQQQIAEMLRRNGPQRQEALATAFAVSMRTIRRDIHTLIEEGNPIVFEPGLGYVWRPTMDNGRGGGTYQVIGRVVERNGVGVPSLRVRVYDDELDPLDDALGSTETDGNGNFAIRITPGEYTKLGKELPTGQPPVFAKLFLDEDEIWGAFPSLEAWDHDERTFAFEFKVPRSIHQRPTRPRPNRANGGAYHVVGGVVDRNGHGVPGLRVSVYDDELDPLHDALGNATTREDGTFAIRITPDEYTKLGKEFPRGKPPIFIRLLHGDELLGVLPSAEVWRPEAQTFGFEFKLPQDIHQGIPPFHANGTSELGRIEETLRDIAAYMPVGAIGGAAIGRASAYGLTDPEDTLDSPINRAFAAVLGTDLDVNMPNDVVRRLNSVFTPVTKDGITTYELQTQPVYTVPADDGTALTGALASYAQLVDSTLGTATSLLKTLKPLSPKIQSHLTDADLAISQTLLMTLKSELRSPTPRQQRIEGLFASIETQLNRIKKEFGLTRENVITPADEQILAGFRVAQSAIEKLQLTFFSLRDEFGGTPQFLGPQLALLRNALSSLADTADMTVNAMTALGYGPLEQRAILLPLPDDAKGKTAPISFDGLISWIRSFTTESQLLIDSGGQRGVAAIIPDARELHKLVKAAETKPEADRAFRHPRIWRLLGSLARQLNNIDQLANRVVE